jgi:hypothetical protein
MSPDEFRRISETSKTIPTVDENGVCSLLVNGKCSVYEVRPAICRLWGIAEEMMCPWGCIPTKFLSKLEGGQFLSKIEKATGRKPMKATIPNLEGLIVSLKQIEGEVAPVKEDKVTNTFTPVHEAIIIEQEKKKLETIPKKDLITPIKKKSISQKKKS